MTQAAAPLVTLWAEQLAARISRINANFRRPIRANPWNPAYSRSLRPRRRLCSLSFPPPLSLIPSAAWRIRTAALLPGRRRFNRRF